MSRTPELFSLSDVFEDASGDDNAQDAVTSEKLYPISFRVTADEKARLQKAAGTMSLSAYVRSQLFGVRAARRESQPKLNAVELARLLGKFGQSEMATHILALSLAAQAGELEVTPDVSGKLERACDDIEEMKLALIVALGMKPRKR